MDFALSAVDNGSLPPTERREHCRSDLDSVAHMNNELFRNLDLKMPSLQERPDVGNWTTRGLRKSGRDYDEVECQRAVAGFLADHQKRDDTVE